MTKSKSPLTQLLAARKDLEEATFVLGALLHSTRGFFENVYEKPTKPQQMAMQRAQALLDRLKAEMPAPPPEPAKPKEPEKPAQVFNTASPEAGSW
jgi:hypothetical protein